MTDWYREVEKLRTFAPRRAGEVRQDIVAHFDLSGTATLALESTTGGKILMGDVAVPGGEGVYFKDVPLHMTAVPNAGFHFLQWQGLTEADSRTISVTLPEDASLRAVFKAVVQGPIVINEINYNAPGDTDPGDWVELHNRGETTIDLSGWTLKDEDDAQSFAFPPGTALAAGGYLVLSQQASLFAEHFPNSADHLGDFEFGLGAKAESVRLFDGEMNWCTR